MASEQMESKATTTTTKSQYEKQLEALWKRGSPQKDETDDDGQGQMHKQPAEIERGEGEIREGSGSASGGGNNATAVQGLPLESSPYVRYTDLEDYKRQAYGTQGHLDPKPQPQIGTDAPTLDGAYESRHHQ